MFPFCVDRLLSAGLEWAHARRLSSPRCQEGRCWGTGGDAQGSLKASLPHLLSMEYMSDCKVVPTLTGVPPAASSQSDLLRAAVRAALALGLIGVVFIWEKPSSPCLKGLPLYDCPAKSWPFWYLGMFLFTTKMSHVEVGVPVFFFSFDNISTQRQSPHAPPSSTVTVQ